MKAVVEDRPWTTHSVKDKKPMDTYRESQLLNGLWDSGQAPWKVWA